MKISINIPELKSTNEFIVINTHGDKKIEHSTLTLNEKDIYQKFISLTDNSDLFQIENVELEMYIHRICDKKVTSEKYIDFNNLSSTDKKIVDDFIGMIKNKI